jgi:hypothetical protein
MGLQFSAMFADGSHPPNEIPELLLCPCRSKKWPLNPLAPKLLHLQPDTFMHVAGIVEILVGIAVLTRFTRYAAYVVMVWMWCIAANLVSQRGFLDIAV